MNAFGENRYVCGKCFNDQGIKEFVESYAVKKKCSFCGARGREPIAAPISEVIDHVVTCIRRYYDDPANVLPYESAEGGYQGETYDTDDVLLQLDLDFPNDDGTLRDLVHEELGNDLWCDAEPFTLSPYQQLEFSWEEFCRIIKHDRRYFFSQVKNDKNSELYSPSEILRIIFEYAQEANMFVSVPLGMRVFRVRFEPLGKKFSSAGTLGPPPVDHAVQTNRMSPPGIAMMYAADDAKTALAETVDQDGTYAIGEFTTSRDALILDLTLLGELPTLFSEVSESMEYDPRPRLYFLQHLSTEISRPIARDDRVHIEYVPTQVVTEYVRTAIKIEGKSVDGIRYRSSQNPGGTALVLFVTQENLILEKEEQMDFYHLYNDRWVGLVKVIRKKVR